MNIPLPGTLHAWLSMLVEFTPTAQPELCTFFNEVAERWAGDFPPQRRGMDA